MYPSYLFYFWSFERILRFLSQQVKNVGIWDVSVSLWSPLWWWWHSAERDLSRITQECLWLSSALPQLLTSWAGSVTGWVPCALYKSPPELGVPAPLCVNPATRSGSGSYGLLSPLFSSHVFRRDLWQTGWRLPRVLFQGPSLSQLSLKDSTWILHHLDAPSSMPLPF